MCAKKIGMLTFSYSSNPGSVLQAYSLQENIEKLGDYEARIINYQKTSAGKPVIGKTVFTPPIRSWRPKKVIEWIARIAAHPMRMRKYEKFFNKRYNGYPTEICTRENLKETEREYDAFVVGSDQVWNLGSPNVDETFFLDFVDNDRKKISYAASFGQKGIPEEKREKISKLIARFESISVREETGVEIVREATGKEATWVLDPSLLTDASVYRAMAKYPKKNGYVFLYLREEAPELSAFAEKLAQEKKLKVVKVLKHWMCGKNAKPLYALGAEEWLGYMDKAEYVITNSFHGICFSMILEKEFFVNLLQDRVGSTNSRIESVLNQFGLEGRGIANVSSFENISRIDYGRVYGIIKDRKEESLSYLKKAIERSVNNDDNLQ